MRTPENIVRHELIGLEVDIKKSKDPQKEKIKGKVFDETKKMLKIDTGDKEVAVPKRESEFLFKLPENEKVKVNGNVIYGRPEERIEKRMPKKWEQIN